MKTAKKNSIISAMSLDEKVTLNIKKHCQKVYHANRVKLSYEGNCLCACLFISEGQIFLKKKNTIKDTYYKNTLIGFNEFLAKKRIGYDLVSSIGLEFYYIDREFLAKLM